jgi:fructokinase
MLTTTHILKYSRDQAHHFARPRLATVPLEVETLGASGVRYRGTMFQRGDRAWRSVPGFGVSQLLDTAGAGDWLSAGLIDFLGSVGARELHQLPRAVIEDGLRTAQAFSAWACGFEGARGGMYRQDSETVRGVVKQTLTAGSTGVLVTGAAADSLHEAFPDLCGACGAIASPSESVDSRAS